MAFFAKLRKILEKPQPPAHMRSQIYREDPWHQRFLDAVRPPSANPDSRASMNRSQRRMIGITLAAMIALGATWVAIDYVSSAPGRARAAFEEGMRAMGSNDFKTAAERFTASIAISQTAEAYLERGNAHLGLGQNQEAVDDWGRAIEHDSSLAAAYTARATYFRRAGQLEKAIPDLDTAIRLAPSVDAYFQRGQIYAEMGQYRKAIDDYDHSILERRQAPYVYLARSIARRALGDEEGFHADQATAAELGAR